MNYKCSTLTAVFALGLSAMPALAGDLAAATQDTTVVVPAPMSANWSGAYAGAVLGGVFSVTETNDYWCYNACDAPGSDGLFGQVGATVGYNQQRGNLVYGIEADIASGGETELTARERYTSGTYYNETDYDFGTKVNWSGTLRARAGLAVNETLMFITAGVQMADVEHYANQSRRNGNEGGTENTSFRNAEFDGTEMGYVAGVGVEHKLSSTLSVKAEYLFSATPTVYGCYRTSSSDGECDDNNGNDDFVDETYGTYFRNSAHSVRLGVNYHF